MEFNGGLDERKRRILRAIIDDYISTAEPVGSRSIVKKYELGFSSATIRNEMADLEDMGYIDQPHTSAGRVPSDKGYRFYVDKLLQKKELTIKEIEAIKDSMEIKMKELNQIVKQASLAMSKITSYTSIATMPKMRKTSIKTIQLVPIENRKVLIIIITSLGEVRNTLINTIADVRADLLIELSNILNDSFAGLTIEEINIKIINDIDKKIRESREILIPILGEVVRSIGLLDDIDLSMEGATNIFNYPEFSNIIKAKEFLDVIGEKNVIYNLIDIDSREDSEPKQGINIKIGKENIVEEMKSCSIVTTTYCMGDIIIGSIGIVGPKRMEYGKVISAMEYIREIINKEIIRFINENQK